MTMKAVLAKITAWLDARLESAETGQSAAELLTRLVAVDTTPNPDPSVMRENEARCFRIIKDELAKLEGEGRFHPVRSSIQNHPSYSLLHFTKTAERPQGLGFKETYEGRHNFVFKILPKGGHNPKGRSLALNAHIDVVAPYFPPAVKDGTVLGRGACDDKGGVAVMIRTAQLLDGLIKEGLTRLNRQVAFMFVIEEETGGNGSLSLAMDRDLRKLYDSVMVIECCGLKIYPANRGAVWYRADLKRVEGASLFEMFAFVNEEMEKEGAAIRAESRHELFPQRPVQTCHAIIGPFGEHPSRICGEAVYSIQFANKPDAKTELLVRDCLEAGLANYIGLYGDKTKVTDPATGKPMVARHYEFQREGNGFKVRVHGAAGHMGAIRERDGAITKMAHFVRSLVASKLRIETMAGEPVRLELAGEPDGEVLVLEGGQGFVPTHDINEVMNRMRQAARRGAENYLRRLGRAERGEDVVAVAYEKLHNVAFDGNPNSPSMRNAIAAARQCGLWKNEPVLGWTVSCDARLFATEYPGMEVLTFGPGELAVAHSDEEQIPLEAIRVAAEFLALFLLRQTGTVAA
jgi:acetylornithine deacetylase/succinyl-diaminopimelate desuccinylase-like protein